MYVKAAYEVAKKYRGDDFFLMPRAAYTGSSAYGVFWGGDIGGTQEGLRASIIAVQRAAVMGYPNWGSDTCGYNQQLMEQEVCARWLAFSCFHADHGSRPDAQRRVLESAARAELRRGVDRRSGGSTRGCISAWRTTATRSAGSASNRHAHRASRCSWLIRNRRRHGQTGGHIFMVATFWFHPCGRRDSARNRFICLRATSGVTPGIPTEFMRADEPLP